MHKIGSHVVGGARNGYGNIAPSLVCACAVGEAGAFDELDDRAIKVYRDQSNPNHVDAPGDLNTMPEENLFTAGEWWFAQLYPTVKPVIDRYTNVYWQPVNEINNPRIVPYLDGFMTAAHAAGVNLALFGDAGDSPVWEDWIKDWFRLLKKAAGMGHIYSRHVYAGVHPDSTANVLTNTNSEPHDPMTARPFREALYLAENGVNIPIMLTETGWGGGYEQPPNGWLEDLGRYNQWLTAYKNIIGVCLWTWGEWPTRPNANLSGGKTAELYNWLKEKTPQWFSSSAPPEPPPTKPKLIVLKAPQEATAEEWQKIAAYGYQYRHDQTASHDTTLSIMAAGNSGSFVKMVYPGRPSQQETISMLENLGYRWIDVTGDIFPVEPAPPWHEGLKFEPVFRVPHRITSRFNAPRDYGNGLHEGVDLDIFTGESDSKEPVLCIYPGVVTYAGYKPNAYGHRVIVRSQYNGVQFDLWYCHMDSTFVSVGTTVLAGRHLGELGGTGPNSGDFAEHIHINMQVPGMGLDGYVIPDVIDPEPFLTVIDEPPAEGVDLVDYICPPGTRQYIMRAEDGSQERYRPQSYKDGHLIQKGKQGEKYEWDSENIHLVWDTTPNDDEYYVRSEFQGSENRSPYTARYLAVGQSWTHDENHYVAFYWKNNCKNSGSIHEGYARQSAKLIARYESLTTKYGATFNDVVCLETGTERQYYARGIGRIGWEMTGVGASWATAENVSGQDPLSLELPTCL